ncbi:MULTISPECIES: hypothetical protein [Pedobacter]|jgi:hypothetical protein|uniref:Uncharacterized protein n=2 Tax=Pedobacter TaxID=84567 RepID=A0A9X3DCB0_9SPHI|nr:MULTISPECIES: hypothetical protein [Pedobacter]RZJ40562.1 MAG: hypothetical protein EOO19_15475 [Chryseobacterium sp.]RZK20645.1 MAG: hypothetical protein EOO86_03720 [Pedobacter sp.]AZI24543.1 hypothetical protein EA772_03985 [Pedobacter sp. G11]MCX3264774.1 hypothetical protein [Pedobacter agri]MDQ1140438.1 hypothetical protein [Pedobacter agri]
MKNVNTPKNNPTTQGSSIADRANHDVKVDKKIQGITNGGGQRSDQTSNKDNQRKYDNKK